MTCGCGRKSKRLDGRCHPCYVREWKHARRQLGARRSDGYKLPCVDDWFDWAIVCKAWDREPLPRRLTRAERVYLAGLIAPTDMGWRDLREILGMDWDEAAQLVSDVRSGKVQVPARAWDGTAA